MRFIFCFQGDREESEFSLVLASSQSTFIQNNQYGESPGGQVVMDSGLSLLWGLCLNPPSPGTDSAKMMQPKKKEREKKKISYVIVIFGGNLSWVVLGSANPTLLYRLQNGRAS